MGMRLVGQPVAQALRQDIQFAVDKWKARNIMPRMVTLLVGEDKASAVYAQQKARWASRLGIAFDVQRLNGAVTTSDLQRQISLLSGDASIHGIMLELPLPAEINGHAVFDSIHALKDVDGLSPCHSIAQDQLEAALYPATPLACIRLLKHYGYSLQGVDVTVIGCGQTVGMPLIHLLIGEGATVVACHEHTRDIAAHLHRSAIAFVAVGRPGLITADMVHEGLTVVDVGISEGPDGVLGDLDHRATEYVEAYTPTPGGIGAVTTSQIFANLLHAMDLQWQVGSIR